MKLTYARQALHDLNRLNKFMGATAPNSMELAALRLLWGFDSIKTFPRIGYKLDHLKIGTREFLVPFGRGNYVIRYQIRKNGDVVVLHIWHNREKREG